MIFLVYMERRITIPIEKLAHFADNQLKKTHFFEGSDFLELDSNEFPEITW